MGLAGCVAAWDGWTSMAACMACPWRGAAWFHRPRKDHQFHGTAMLGAGTAVVRVSLDLPG